VPGVGRPHLNPPPTSSPTPAQEAVLLSCPISTEGIHRLERAHPSVDIIDRPGQLPGSCWQGGGWDTAFGQLGQDMGGDRLHRADGHRSDDNEA